MPPQRTKTWLAMQLLERLLLPREPLLKGVAEGPIQSVSMCVHRNQLTALKDSASKQLPLQSVLACEASGGGLASGGEASGGPGVQGSVQGGAASGGPGVLAAPPLRAAPRRLNARALGSLSSCVAAAMPL